jgi:hypothetical protein
MTFSASRSEWGARLSYVQAFCLVFSQLRGRNPFADEVTIELRETGEKGRTPMPFIAMMETFQLPQRVEEVDRRAAPSRQRGYEDDVDLRGLGDRHDFATLGAVELCARTGLLENSHHLETGSTRNRCQVALLSCA